MTSSTRRSAASAKTATSRIDAGITAAPTASGCLLSWRPEALGMRGRNAPWDDCRTFRGKLWLGGSYSTTGMTAKSSERGGLTLEVMVNGTLQLKRGTNSFDSQIAEACWRVADNWVPGFRGCQLSAIIAQPP